VNQREPRKTKPEAVGRLLPEAARALGLEEELRRGQRTTAFRALLVELAPHLAADCSLISVEHGQMIVEASTPAAAQELHLRGREIATAFATWPGGERTFGVTARIGPARHP
jgi:hypothetical protein